MRIVAALGGNALLRRGEPLDAVTQRSNARPRPGPWPRWPTATSSS
jgi:hypothetical protein